MQKYLLLGFILLAMATSATAETMTLTTYYPAPSGRYVDMRAKRMTVGTTYMPDTSVGLTDNNLIVEGRVGIGTGATAPAGILQVHGGNFSTEAELFRLSYMYSSAMQRSLRVLQPTINNNDDPFIFQTSNALAFRIDDINALMINSAGNVGIGTTNPLANLDIVSAASTSGLTGGGNLRLLSVSPQIDFVDSNNNDWAIHVNDKKMYFIRQPWEVSDLVLDGTGNVGIGTTVPTTTLDVDGTIKARTGLIIPSIASGGAAPTVNGSIWIQN